MMESLSKFERLSEELERFRAVLRSTEAELEYAKEEYETADANLREAEHNVEVVRTRVAELEAEEKKHWEESWQRFGTKPYGAGS